MKGLRKLTLQDLLLTSYGQTRKEVIRDYENYLKTGDVAIFKEKVNGISTIRK